MPELPDQTTSDEYHLNLYQWMVSGDPTAQSDLICALLPLLVDWLGRTVSHACPDLREQAAEDALLNLIKNPDSFQPEKASLQTFLRMSAKGDVLNLMAREKNRTGKEISLNLVEQSPDAGKYLGREDDPSSALQAAEDRKRGWAKLAARGVLDGLSKEELSALELLLEGEKTTSAFAEVLGITHLSMQEQRTQVNRVKDKLKRRLQRKGISDD